MDQLCTKKREFWFNKYYTEITDIKPIKTNFFSRYQWTCKLWPKKKKYQQQIFCHLHLFIQIHMQYMFLLSISFNIHNLSYIVYKYIKLYRKLYSQVFNLSIYKKKQLNEKPSPPPPPPPQETWRLRKLLVSGNFWLPVASSLRIHLISGSLCQT